MNTASLWRVKHLVTQRAAMQTLTRRGDFIWIPSRAKISRLLLMVQMKPDRGVFTCLKSAGAVGGGGGGRGVCVHEERDHPPTLPHSKEKATGRLRVVGFCLCLVGKGKDGGSTEVE